MTLDKDSNSSPYTFCELLLFLVRKRYSYRLRAEVPLSMSDSSTTPHPEHTCPCHLSLDVCVYMWLLALIGSRAGGEPKELNASPCNCTNVRGIPFTKELFLCSWTNLSLFVFCVIISFLLLRPGNSFWEEERGNMKEVF